MDKLDGEYAVELYDGRFAKPIDGDLLRRLLTAGTPVITVEDHSIRGGFGAAVLETCNALGLDTRLVTRMALPDQWIYQGERKEQLAEAGIDGAAIARTIRAILESQLVSEASPAVAHAK